MIKLRKVILDNGTEKVKVVSESSDIKGKRKKMHDESYKRRKEKEYEHNKKISVLTPKEREFVNFWIKVDKKGENECWIWLGAIDGSGYGTILYNGKLVGAHRVSYILEYGEISDDELVLHGCDNKLCVNPKHLHTGSYKKNAEEREERNRGNHASGERNGNSKLNWTLVKDIRKEYENGDNTVTIAIKYGIADTTVGLIINNEIWKDDNYKSRCRSGKEGENHPFAKRTRKIIREIREKYIKYGTKFHILAKEYGIDKGTISRIINNKTWIDDNYDCINKRYLTTPINLSSVNSKGYSKNNESSKEYGGNETKTEFKKKVFKIQKKQ